jgi:ABC-type transport system substrate-binding protein
MYYLIGVGFNQLTDAFQFVYHSRYVNPEFTDAVGRLRAAARPEEMRPLLSTLAAIFDRHDYCPNKSVEAELAQAEGGNVPDAGKKEHYLRAASLLTERGGQNRMRYCNPQLDDWIVEAERESDRARKIEMYAKVQRRISEDLPQIYLWYPATVLIAGSRVGNIETEASGSWYFIAKLTLKD